ncbi:hypothetical protein FACS1894167_04800 [Synergistales bacterium]|nr:hypothetical protein FACS1894167_04800 [Synergistales bacterium]
MRHISIDGVEVAELRPEHARIYPRLRAADMEEARAASDMDPRAAIAYSIASSRPGYAALLRGEPEVIFGASPRPDGGGVPWLLATDEAQKHPVAFYRASKEYINEMREAYPYLENYVDARNHLSIRWLKWAGFFVEPAEPGGVRGERFHRFWSGKGAGCGCVRL